MSTKRPLEATQQLPLTALLGLQEAGEADWDRVRALQFGGLRKYAVAKTIGMVCAAIVAFSFMLNSAHPIPAIGWVVVLLGVYGVAHVRQHRLSLWDCKTVGRKQVLQTVGISAAGGAVWAAGFLFFGYVGDLNTLTLIWLTSLCVLAGAASLLSSLPLASLAFVAIAGFGAGVGFLLAQSLHHALLALTMTSVLLISIVPLARNFVRGQIAETNLGDRDQVVSLLLREHEDSGADWLWQLDSSRQLVHASQRLAKAFGQNLEEINGRPFLQLLAGDSWETGNFPKPLHDLAENLKRRASFSNLLVPVEINGERRWWELSGAPKLSDEKRFVGFRGVASDVTDKRESAEKIAHLARYDTLTGLPNRLHLTEELGNAMENATKWNGRWSIMMIDLDRFKAVNDTLGHPIGDRLLARVAERMGSVLSDNEICGRLGGDEFAIVVRDAGDSEYLPRLAKRIIDTVSRPYEVDQHTIYIGASVGSATGPRDGRTVETLMRSADLALYRSKEKGGNVHHAYEPQLHVQAEERRVMEIELRKALEKNQLSLNYQPVVSADTGGLTGFEALIRWTHPEFGPVSPAKFIPIAEEARLIVPIGAWVMQTACKEAVNWPEHVKVAVNVSADQLHDSEFLKMVTSALRESGLPPYRLEVEVTESLFMREGTNAARILDELIAMGINLSLDDFGTGYSSLGYLRKTRFSTIKVDRSFVQGAAKNVPESLAIIRAVVAMADSLGMATTAEGAETEDEVRMIRKLGCRKIQGYYFGRPMSSQDARAIFDRSSGSKTAPKVRAA